jgi:ABC-type ATPase with predicted acetyltransferase domain
MTNLHPIKHNVNIKFSTAVERTDRVLEISQAFGLELSDKEFCIYEDFKFQTTQGDRIYVSGQSGSGKSLILREMEKDYRSAGLNVTNIQDVELQDKPLIDQLGKTTQEAVQLLQIAGIGDAYLLIRKPSELSDGQRYRLRVAKLIEANTDVWICDEFGAVLDRVTAKLLAHSISKIARKNNKTVVIATTHRDLIFDFAPTISIYKEYGHIVETYEVPIAAREIY